MLRFARRIAFPLCAVFMASCADSGPAAPDAVREQPLNFTLQEAEWMDYVPDVSAIARFTSGNVPTGAAFAKAAFIGPEGGSIRLYDYEIVIPPGAVTNTRRFEIRIPPFPSQRKYATVWLSPHGYQFNKPVTLRLPLEGTESEGGADIHVLWWADREWVALPTQPTPDGRIEATTTHFSLYATQRRGFTLAGG